MAINLIYHKNLTVEKWSAYSKAQQILMIANELNRAKNMLEKSKVQETNLCYERAFELIDLTVEDIKWRKNLKELLRMREMLGMLYVNDNKEIKSNNQVLDCLVKMHHSSYKMFF